MAQPCSDPFDEQPGPARRISQVTRRDIFDYLNAVDQPWWGRIGEVHFLGRLYDLDALRSTERRHAAAGGDIIQRRIANCDWE